jgi:hypothetical protein
MAHPVRRQFFALAKRTIRVWQAQSWMKRIVKEQAWSVGEPEPGTLRDELRFQDNVTFGHQLGAA